MMDVEKTMKYLRQEFGISTIEELDEAIQKMPDLDIGLFVSPIFQKLEETA